MFNYYRVLRIEPVNISVTFFVYGRISKLFFHFIENVNWVDDFYKKLVDTSYPVYYVIKQIIALMKKLYSSK